MERLLLVAMLVRELHHLLQVHLLPEQVVEVEEHIKRVRLELEALVVEVMPERRAVITLEVLGL